MFEFLKSPNFILGRKNYKPEAVVIHITDGPKKSVISWFLNPESKVSAHYLVCKNGDLIKFVDEKDTAFHCGVVKNPTWKLLKPNINPNFYTIGIEFEGKNNEHPTLPQLHIGIWLLFKICAKWDIPIDTDHIIPHNWINKSKICPGSGINFEYLIRLAQIFKNSKTF